jgi:hypothetical protein
MFDTRTMGAPGTSTSRIRSPFVRRFGSRESVALHAVDFNASAAGMAAYRDQQRDQP